MIINLDGELYRVTYAFHVTPGKGVACMQTKLKNLKTDKNLEYRFRSNDRVEKADLETRQMQFLYKEAESFVFMDMDNFEQHPLSKAILEGKEPYLQEGSTYDVLSYNNDIVDLTLPKTMDFKVITAPPELKKATATAKMRPVTLENGLSVQAPAFVKEGDIIRVNTETSEYLERVK